ncbi:MAG: sialidase family protein [archaeon]
MAVELSTELAAAQNNLSRKPIVNLTSNSIVPSVPFDGNLLTNYNNETEPNIINYSSGRLCLVTLYDNNIRYTYTNESRTEFNYVDYDLGIGNDPTYADLCEMANGNICIIYKYNNEAKYKIISVDGEEIDNGDLGFTDFTQLFFVRLNDDSYFMVYVKGSDDYNIYKRTSSDCINWSEESTINLSGIGTGNISNPHLFVESNGDLILTADHVNEYGDNDEKLTNCYMSVSSDNGVTFSDPVKITNYDSYGSVAEHPTFIQKTEDTAYFTYTEKNNVLKIDHKTSGYCGVTAKNATGCYFNPTTRKLYFADRHVYSGTKRLGAAIEIDTGVWEISDCWGYSTVPSFNEIFKNDHTNDPYHIGTDGSYFCPAFRGDTVPVVDTVNNSIRNYIFRDNLEYGLEANIDNYERFAPSGTGKYNPIIDVIVNQDTKKLWIIFGGYSIWSLSRFWLQVGYIDLTQEVGPYTWNEVITYYFKEDYSYFFKENAAYYIDEDNDYLIFTNGATYGSGADLRIVIMSLSENAIVKQYYKSEYDALPKNGFVSNTGMFGSKPSIHYDDINEKLYCGIKYCSDSTEEDKRGLMELDLNNNSITYHRPTHETKDEYYLKEFFYVEDRDSLLMVCGKAVLEFSLVTKTWKEYSSNTIPGFCPFAESKVRIYSIDYDPINEQVFVSWNIIQYGSAGMSSFNLEGSFSQSQYALGTKSEGEWSFGEFSELTEGMYEYDLVTAVDPDDSGIYGFWNSTDNEKIKWDKEEGVFTLDDYLSETVTISKEDSIDSSPNKITFGLSHGHLFDPYNYSSLFSYKVAKGRRLVLKFGENINGVEHFQEQGVYYVSELQMSYGREKYPIMKITAEDRRTFWESSEIRATTRFDDSYPEYIIKEILKAYTNMEDEDFEDTVFDNLERVKITHQWLDTNLLDIIDQIYNRFGCFIKFNTNGNLDFGTLSLTKTVSNTYTARDTIIEYSPDDKYSDFTNRVTIEAQEKNHIEVMYPEEQITTLSGTVGWWGYKNDFRIWYSEDKSRRCANPRLEVIETTTGIAFKLAGKISEKLVDDDPYKLSCKVVVEAPSLVVALLIAIAIYIAATAVGDIAPSFGGMTIPVGRLLEKGGLVGAILILGAVGNFQYAVHAQPLGKVQRLIQATADDEEHQQKIGAVIEKRFFDPLCNEVVHCKEVAEFELSIAQAQRKRAKIKKVANLQDEIGDIITVPHIYSLLPINIFITNMNRTFNFSSSGGFYDEIEGWIV